jgi:hypothetical protein
METRSGWPMTFAVSWPQLQEARRVNMEGFPSRTQYLD